MVTCALASTIQSSNYGYSCMIFLRFEARVKVNEENIKQGNFAFSQPLITTINQDCSMAKVGQFSR